jgi:hypothetical protein
VELKKGETIMTDASLHLPAACLHEAFSALSGVPPDHFELYYRGKRLEGEAALSSWGVGKNATIEVKMRGRGGGCVGAKEASSVKEAAMAAAAPPLAASSPAEALQEVGSSADSASTERAASPEKATAAEKIAAEKQVGKKAAADEAVAESLVIKLHGGGMSAGGSNDSGGSDGGGGVRGVGGGSEVDITAALRTGVIELHGGLTLEPAQASIAAIAHLPTHPAHKSCSKS